MIYLYEISFLVLNVVMAAIHASIIANGKPVNHLLWGGGYLVVAVIVSLMLKNWWLLLCLLLIRKIFFDLSLNIFRGKPLFYVSAKPESVIDRFHNSVFGNKSEVYMTIYFVGLVVLNIFL